MRDVLIHDYAGVKVVWDTEKEELPQLKEDVLKILQEIKAPGEGAGRG